MISFVVERICNFWFWGLLLHFPNPEADLDCQSHPHLLVGTPMSYFNNNGNNDDNNNTNPNRNRIRKPKRKHSQLSPAKDEFTKSRSEYSPNSPAKNSTKARCINKGGKKVKELVQKGRRVQSFLFGDYAYAGDDGGDNGNLNSKWGGNKEEARSMRLLRDIQDEVKDDA